jgi:phosphoglycolate phosphatase
MSMSSLELFKIRTVIFDLDGTLIDSAAAILEGFEYAIKRAGIDAVLPLTTGLIGPPLRNTFCKIVGEDESIEIDELIEEFKKFYDNEGFKKTRPYPGVEKLLRELKESGFILYIATNKRFLPTQKIINYLGWQGLFDDIYAIDKFDKFPFKSKELMVQALLKDKSIDRLSTVYIGDTEDDRVASIKSNIEVILVSWGYGNFQQIVPGGAIKTSPEELLNFILERN